MIDSQIEQTPGLDHVTTHRRIHESRKQWYAEYFGVRKIRVRPGLDRTRSLEDFQSKSDQVEQRNCLDLVPGLQFRPEHQALDTEGDDQ